MDTVARILAALIALEHLWILVLEMFLWTKPQGLRTFNNTLEFARQTAVLAANQGLYNGFLAAGIVFGLLYPDPGASKAITLFFLGCVIVAGSYGGWSVSRRIFFVQAVPAIVAFSAVSMFI
jgi:putative membrane protein